MRQCFFLLSRSYLGLIDLTIYTGLLNIRGRGEQGCLTEAVVLRREEQGKASKRGEPVGSLELNSEAH